MKKIYALSERNKVQIGLFHTKSLPSLKFSFIELLFRHHQLFFNKVFILYYPFLYLSFCPSIQPSVIGALASVIIGAYQQSVNHSAGIYGESFQGKVNNFFQGRERVEYSKVRYGWAEEKRCIFYLISLFYSNRKIININTHFTLL